MSDKPQTSPRYTPSTKRELLTVLEWLTGAHPVAAKELSERLALSPEELSEWRLRNALFGTTGLKATTVLRPVAGA